MRSGMHLLVVVARLLLLLTFTRVAAGKEIGVGLDGRTQTQETPVQPPIAVQREIQELFAQVSALGNSNDSIQQREQLWRRILDLDPHDTSACLQWGLLASSSSDPVLQHRGMESLAKIFDRKAVHSPITMPSSMGMVLAMFIARFRCEQLDYTRAYYYFELALRAARLLDHEETAQTCIELSRATMLHPFPKSVEHADQMYHHYMRSARNFVKEYNRTNPQSLVHKFDQVELGSKVPGAGDDPYGHCVITMFQLSFYYRADVAEAARLHYQAVTTVWPELQYVSPHVVTPKIPPHINPHKPCTTQKIQLGIASGFLPPASSVSADFEGVMQRLDRNIFNVTYIHVLADNKSNETHSFVHQHADEKLLVFARDSQKGHVGNSAFVKDFFPAVEALNLDVLVYLDLTMSNFADRMSMARLAPVQANSHGHPVTSGIAAVDYFISWGAAELDHETANTHYTEELILLNPNVPHQYYTPRHTPDGVSTQDGQPFRDKAYRSFFKRFMNARGPWGDAIFDDTTNNIRWYTCMQKPHKFMPEMDPLLCNVLREDPNGILILHLPDKSEKMLQDFQRRLDNARCDRSRIYFLPALPHHMLLALYQVSTLILDSYPAGGCTTTREALELSKVVVTLPARLLGGRWSYAYYKMLGDDLLNQHVIADSPEDYAQKAVRLGREEALRKEMENRIRDALPNLYEREEAVRSWEHALLTISPVEKRDSCEIKSE